MIERIVSIKQPGLLLHVLGDAAEVVDTRLDLTPPEELIQLSMVPVPPGKIVHPHIHVERPQDGTSTKTQEAWIILKGRIKARLFDLDQNFLIERQLQSGQILVTFHGGHSLEGLEPGTILIECKNGPYRGKDYTVFS